MQALVDVESIQGTPWGIGRIEFEDLGDSKRIRLFLLSILRRASATTRREFSEIQLPKDDHEKLRKMVMEQNPEPLDFYPASLTQLSTLGVRHDHSPFAFTKQIPPLGGEPGYEKPVFQFFLDGLIVHFSRLSIQRNAALNLGPLCVGGTNSLTASTVKYENSAHAQNLAIIATEVALGRPLHEISQGPFSPRRKLSD